MGLAAFGFLNAVLGAALPYLRAVEHISYVVGALHQVAFALGGGLAGVLTARGRIPGSRARVVPAGLAGAALAGVGIAFGARAPVTIAFAFATSLLATAALIRMWAVLADIHGVRRTVALAEGEVLVSAGGIVTPLLVGGLAATALSWRAAFVAGAVGVLGAALALRSTAIPAPTPSVSRHVTASPSPRWRPRWPAVRPTLVIVFAIVGLEFALSFWLATYLHDVVGVRRNVAVLMVSGLYAANLAGRVLASRGARRRPDAAVLAVALGAGLIGTPVLLVAHDLALAGVGIAIAGVGIGAMFPITSSLHVGANPASADTSVGQVLSVAALGELGGPLAAGVLAQAAGLRTGLIVLPAFTLLGFVGLAAHRRDARTRIG